MEEAAEMIKLGATGDFPDGKLAPDDEGGLNAALVADHQHGMVRIEFGKNLSWLALPPDSARQLAASLITFADQLDGGRNERKN
jgi:hypothetical protein